MRVKRTKLVAKIDDTLDPNFVVIYWMPRIVSTVSDICYTEWDYETERYVVEGGYTEWRGRDREWREGVGPY